MPDAQTVLITGANRGIGFALTKKMLAAGDRVLATCREPERATALNALAADNLRVLPLDVTSHQDTAALAKQLQGQRVDVLVNNAGIMSARQSLDDMDFSAWQAAFDVHVLAPFRLTMALRANLQLAHRPRVITISSQMGALQRQSMGAYAYRTSKAAANKLMQTLALELRADGIIACPVHPGWVRTDMGGAAADLGEDESADGLRRLIERLQMADSGRFWTWDGQEHPW